MEEFDHGWIQDHIGYDPKLDPRDKKCDHPIKILTSGKLPIDTWYKVYGAKNGTR